MDKDSASKRPVAGKPPEGRLGAQLGTFSRPQCSFWLSMKDVIELLNKHEHWLSAA